MIKNFKQCYKYNYKEIFTVVVKLSFYQILFIFIVYYNLEMNYFNVITAFLNNKLNELIYVKQLHDFETEELL